MEETGSPSEHDSEDQAVDMECETAADTANSNEADGLASEAGRIPSTDQSDTVPPVLQGGGDWNNNLAGLSDLLNKEEEIHVDSQKDSGQPKEGPLVPTSYQSTTPEQTYQGPGLSTSVGDRAKAYIKKKKENLIVELKNSLGEHLLTYEAVRAANQKLLAAPYLQSGAPTVEEVLPQDGDFFSTADGRVLRMHMESNLPLKSNAAFSFNPWKMVCTNCLGAPNHPVLGYPRNKPEDNPGREAIILSDYSYPPILPSSLYKKCLRIIRPEHGNIFELTNILLDKLRGQQLSGGSIVMIFSAAHLARVGLKSYIKDIVTAKRE